MDDATSLLLGILGHPLDQLLPGDINQLVPEGKPLAVNDDLFHSDLLLAARCLVGKPQIQMQGLRDRIIAEVKRLLENSLYRLDWEQAAKVLVTIGDNATIDNLLAMVVGNGIELEKQIGIISAFRELSDPTVVHCLLKLLERDIQLHKSLRLNILYVLADLKAAFTVPRLLTMLKAEEEDGIQQEILRVLGELGDESVIPELLEMLTDQKRNEWARKEIALTVARLGEQSGSSELLQMLLLDKTPNSLIEISITQALRELRDKSSANSVLELINNETINWKIRWLLTESLEGLQESVIEPLREMLQNPRVDPCVKVGIAATIGNWGFRESIPYLLNAIECRVIPPNLYLGNTGYIGYLWKRIIRTLKNLGDDSIISVLVKAFTQHVSGLEQRVQTRKWLNELKGIITAASEYKPEAAEPIARELIKMLCQSEWQAIQLTTSLSQLTTKSLIPELLVLLEKRRMYHSSEGTWALIVIAISHVADDCKTIEALREMMPKTLNNYEEQRWANAIYSALYSISRRAKVRVSCNR
jgi:HEAT repeat protein